MPGHDPLKIRPRSRDWHISGWRAVWLSPLILPIAICAGFFSKPKRRSPAEVAGFIRDLLEGRGGEWDWNDFTSVRLADSELEAIRRDADLIALPVSESGREQLKALLARAESLKTEWLKAGQPE